MPQKAVTRNETVDNDFFRSAVLSYTNGKPVIANPTYFDFIQYYGSNRAIADTLVKEGAYQNVNSAMRQLQRIAKNPGMKMTSITKGKLATLYVIPQKTKITIKGWYTYDYQKWKYGTFSDTVSPSDMERIMNASMDRDVSTSDNNQNALNMFMDVYGTGFYPSFATGTSVTIEEG